MTDQYMTITIKLDVGNDEAVASDTSFYVGQHVREIGRNIMKRQPDAITNKNGKIRDGNGNTIGQWRLDGNLD